MERLQYLDLAKGVLILLVVIGHVGTYIPGQLEWLDLTTRTIYTFHMPAFLIISGLLFRKSIDRRFGSECKTDTTQYIYKTLLTYGVPYIAFSLVYYLVKLCLSNFAHTPISTNEILLIALYPFGYLWFLYVVLLAEVVYLVARRRLSTTTIDVIVPVVALVLYFAQTKISKLFPDTISSDFSINYIYFVVGFYYKAVIDRIKSLSERNTALDKIPAVVMGGGKILIIIILATIWLLSSQQYLYHGSSDSVLLILLYKLIAALSGSYILIKICRIITCWVNTQYIQYFGTKTLSIYLMHDYVIVFVFIVIGRLFDNTTCLAIMSVILGCVIPVLLDRLFLKTKYLGFIFYPMKYIKLK